MMLVFTIMKERPVRILLFILAGILSSIPIHEVGHYLAAISLGEKATFFLDHVTTVVPDPSKMFIIGIWGNLADLFAGILFFVIYQFIPKIRRNFVADLVLICAIVNIFAGTFFFFVGYLN